jgi:epoxyqueuosine reductase QueG
MNDSALLAAIREEALAAGFADIGFCSVRPFAEWQEKASESIRSRVSHDPAYIMPEANSILVAVRRYGIFAPWPSGTASVANYYVESNIGFQASRKLADGLAGRGYKVLANPRLPARQAQGKNMQFCHDRFGPLVSLHLILTDAPLDGRDESYRRCQPCIPCGDKCEAACPTGALTEDGFDLEHCLRQHMLQGTRIPDWMRETMGTRLLGCTGCQYICPLAAQAGNTAPLAIPRDLLEACAIDRLLALDRGSIRTLVAYAGSNFIRPLRVRRQAAIAAGNSGNRAYLPLLQSLLTEPDEVLQDHAAWAIAKLGGSPE